MIETCGSAKTHAKNLEYKFTLVIRPTYIYKLQLCRLRMRPQVGKKLRLVLSCLVICTGQHSNEGHVRRRTKIHDLIDGDGWACFIRRIKNQNDRDDRGWVAINGCVPSYSPCRCWACLCVHELSSRVTCLHDSVEKLQTSA